MSVYKQPKRKWAAEVQHKTEAGETERITQEGFTSKQKALRWERGFRPREIGNMTLREFVQFYCEDKAPHLGEERLAAKRNIINTMLIPYLGDTRLCDMTLADVLEWQKVFTNQNDLRTARNQFNELLHHAVRFYGFEGNLARSAGNVQMERKTKRKPQVRDEFQHFIEGIADGRLAHYCSEVLSWSGIRVGELLALTAEDIDLERKTILVGKTFQAADGGELASEPRPLKIKRKIKIPGSLCDELRNYMGMLSELKDGDRLFPIPVPQTI